MCKFNFDFTKDEYEMIKEKLMLNDELLKILEMRIKNCTIVEISLATHLSESTVKRRLNVIKKKLTKIL